MAAWDIKGRDALSATALGGTAAGAPWYQGDFNPQIGGSGTALQSGAIPTWLLLAAVVGGAWLLLRRR
ncbi:MAG TPA: hypothetical protein VF442_10550 [Sphingobium sp.]